MASDIPQLWDNLFRRTISFTFNLLTLTHLANSHRRFNSDRDDMWQDCSSSKYASTDAVTFLTWRHMFKMAAMTSFHVRTPLAVAYYNVDSPIIITGKE